MIPASDLLVQVLNGGRGGQHTNGPDLSPVRVTHIPTGTVAEVGHQKSQHRNRHAAIRMIEAHLTDPEVR